MDSGEEAQYVMVLSDHDTFSELPGASIVKLLYVGDDDPEFSYEKFEALIDAFGEAEEEKGIWYNEESMVIGVFEKVFGDTP